MEIVKGKGYYNCREFTDIKEMIFQSMELYHDSPAFKFRVESNAAIQVKTYSDLKKDLCALGTALFDYGLQGSHMCVIGDNSYHWALSYLTCICGGSVAVPLDAKLTEIEIITLLERSKAKVVFYNKKFQLIMERYAVSHPHIEKYICISYDDVDLSSVSDDRFMNLSTLISQGHESYNNGTLDFVDAKIDPHKVSFLLFTSGTTSQSKAVMLNHHNIITDIKGIASFVRLYPQDHLLSVLPLHHTFENSCGLLMPLYFGACVAYSDGLKYISRNIKEYKIKAMIVVPLLLENMYKKIIDNIRSKKKYLQYRIAVHTTRLLNNVKIDLREKLFAEVREQLGNNLAFVVCGAAPLSSSISREFEDFGIRIIQGYGLTETAPVIAGCNFVVQEHGTCGHPLPGVDMMIDNQTDGEIGEICVKGGNVMVGYMDDQDATNQVIDQEGWFHTGDLGRLTKKKNLLITGRAKSMIVLKNGKKVFPEEVEELINQLSYVKESMVFGENSTNDEVLLCVRLSLSSDEITNILGSNYSDQDIIHLLTADIKSINKKMPVYKHIRYTFFGFEELPKTTTLKIKRYLGYEEFKEVLSKAAISLKEAAHKNFDKLKESLNAQKQQS